MYPINQVLSRMKQLLPFIGPELDLFLLLAIHTTKHFGFDRELHLAPHLISQSRQWGEQFLVVEIYSINTGQNNSNFAACIMTSSNKSEILS